MEKGKGNRAMKVVSIAIKSRQDVLTDFAEAFEAAQKRLPFKARRGIYFTSLEAVRNFLTPKRLELLHLIKEKNPRSIYELAKISGRSFPSVLRDTELLTRHGLLKLPRVKDSSRRAIHPSVDYDAINLWIGI